MCIQVRPAVDVSDILISWQREKEIFTLAPRLPNSNAIPAPIPREAPVTIAVFPWRGRLGLSEDMA
jgi:hypothetical protein